MFVVLTSFTLVAECLTIPPPLPWLRTGYEIIDGVFSMLTLAFKKLCNVINKSHLLSKL